MYRRVGVAIATSVLLSLAAFIFIGSTVPAVPVPAPVPGTFHDTFDDGMVGPEYTPIGGATLIETGGQLRVIQSAPGDGVLVTYPDEVGGETLYAFCVRWGMDIVQQLVNDGDQIVVRAYEPGQNPLRGSGNEKIRWEIEKVERQERTYTYKVYKDGELKQEGRVRIPEGTKGFRIDKKPGTNMIIGEVIMSDGSWEKLWEKDPPPPEEPFDSFSITSNMDEFALDDVMGGLHTDDPNSAGALGDLSIAPLDEGGVVFTPLGGDLYDVEVTLDSIATFPSEETDTIEVELQIGEPARVLRAGVTCKGTGTGTCKGRSSCSTKTCPDREYDIGDGNGFQTYTGTCKKAKLGLPLCSCSYKPKRKLSAVEIQPGEVVRVVVDPDNTIPEIFEGDNVMTTRPSIDAFAVVESYSCQAGNTPLESTPAKGPIPPDEDGISLTSTVRLTSGYLDLSQVDLGSVLMTLVADDGTSSRAVAPANGRAEGRALVLDFSVDPSMGISSCPSQLVLTGATAPPSLRFFSAVTAAAAVTDADVFGLVNSLIEELENYPPDMIQLGTLVIVPNAVTGQLIAIGDAALPALFSALSTGSRVQQSYSAFVLGEIGNPSAIVPLSDELAILQAIPNKVLLDFTAIGAIQAALAALEDGDDPQGDDDDDPSDPDTTGKEKRCCVTDAEIVTDGAFQGGKKLGDYYPDLAQPDGSSTYWSGDGSQGGAFDTGSRTGGAVQIIGTMEGDRDCCTMTQHFVVEESNYPGGDVGPVGESVDDIARSGRDPSGPPFRQNIGGNQISMADPPSAPYGPPNDFKRKLRFTTCFVSYPDSKPECEWKQCCVTWVQEQEAQGGAMTTNKIFEVGSWCE